MLADRITQLGYLGLEVSDIARWKEYAADLLGLAPNGTDADGTVFLRMDENHHRIALRPGATDDIAYAGWEVRDEAALRAVADRLESQAIAVAWGTPSEAAARRVMGLIKLTDPNGIGVEVYCGPLIQAERPFKSPRAIGGFEAGHLGAGHIVLSVDDYEASLRFYRDGLGLLISDFIELDMGGAGTTRVAFLHCGPRHHSLAFAQFPAPKRLHHVMLQLRDMDDVGATYDVCVDKGVTITSTMGRHTNDRMTSFYMQTPSGFQVEYGHGGRLIDDERWEVQLHRAPSLWGHRAPSIPRAPAGA
jgi:biphenyl-2,3-diol 1,2-dioxygenase